MAIDPKPLPLSTPAEDLTKAVREVIQDLVDQLNQRGQVYVSGDGRIPSGLIKNDVIITTYRGKISIQIKRSRGFDRLVAEHFGGLTANGTNFVGVKTDNTAPTVNHFTDNDWGFYNQTGGSPGFFLVFNIGGAIKSVALV